MSDVPSARSDRLLEVLSRFPAVVIVTHNNPDPDAIASGWAIHRLVEERLHKPARLIAGGIIVRAENLHMVKLLKPPLLLVDSYEDDGSGIVLVDCVPPGTNHILSGMGLPIAAVTDHHLSKQGRYRASFRDIRKSALATASLVAGYLREQEVVLPPELATALLYAIRTEMRGDRTQVSRTDRWILTWLSASADHAKLAQIESAPLAREYFSDLLLAIESTFVYDRTALCYLPQASGQETLGEVADLLVRCEGLDKVLCAAVIGEHLLLSARTSPDGGDANALLRKAVEGLGSSGGHAHRAGGKASPHTSGLPGMDEVKARLRQRWLEACGIPPEMRGARLVARKDILQGL